MYEKVNPQHPDKIADRIAGALVDLAYKERENPHVAVEVLIGHKTCHIINETDTLLDERDVIEAVKRITRNGNGDFVVDYKCVPQDNYLNEAQKKNVVCGDNGIFRGYDPLQKPKITTFANDMHSTDIVFDTGDYYSMCEHHMLPFFGKYYFAYIPKENGRILGISKVARVVGYCSARLQLQERLARDVVNMLMEALNGEVEGMAIVMKGTHLCKTMRGVRNNGQMSVAHLTGVFQSNGEARREFYKLIELQR